MVRQEQRISNDVGKARRESSKKMKPEKVPRRGPGIAVLEMLRRDEPHRLFSSSTEVIFRSHRPQSNLPMSSFPKSFDPSSSLGCYLENFNVPLYQLLDSSPLVSDDGTAPPWWSSFQNNTYLNPNSQFAGALGMKEAPDRPQLPMPSLLNQHENHQQIPLVSAGYSNQNVRVSGACLRIKSEPPSIQSRNDILNASSWLDKGTMTHQIAGMKRPWPFQSDTSKFQWFSCSEPIHIPHPDCDTLMINGMPGKPTDLLTDGASSLCNVGGNLNINHPAVERNVVSGEDIASHFDGGTINGQCSSSSSTSTLPQKTTSIQLSLEKKFLHIQKKVRESGGSKASASPSPSKTDILYNFMGLHHADFVADPHVTANQIKRSLDSSDAVDVELKL